MDKEIIIGIDSANQFYLGYELGFLYDEQRIRNLIRQCAEAGITTIYWRVSCTGQVAYRSKVRTVIGSKPPRTEGFRFACVENLIIKQCDPPAVAVDEGHKCGLKVFAYVTLFDEYYPDCESEFEIRNPQYTWKHRLRDHHIRGLLSYAYPEVRQHRLAEIKELISYGVDGIYLDVARTHSGIQPIVAMPLTGKDPYLQYGFNEPEVEEFKRRYDVDPTIHNPADAPLVEFDTQAWNKLRGEYLTQFLRKVREETNQANIELTVGFYTDADCYLSPAGRRGRVPMGHFYHDYQTWVDEDIVDGFVIIAEHRRYGAKDWREHSKDQFQPVQENGKKVYIWSATESRIDEMENPPAKLPISIVDNRDMFLKALEQAIHQCLDTSADGIYLYEAYDIEKFNYWDNLKQILSH